jgi:hypothetical protein
MQKNVLRTIGVALLLVLIGAASASALKIEINGITVSATATVEPRELPAKGGTPVEVESVTRVKSTTGEMASPLSQLIFKFDRHGFVDTKGLPVCTSAKLAGTTPSVARKRCAGAIVGEGVGKAQVALPGAPPSEISSPLTFFNAPPQGGKPGLIIHAYETIPQPQTFLVPTTIERIHEGRYGYQVQIDLPPIAAGYGAATLAKATIGATWKRGGKTVGYTNAYCSGGRLQVYGKLRLEDGSLFPGTLTSPCHVPG